MKIDSKRILSTLEKIVSGEQLLDTDWINIANLAGFLNNIQQQEPKTLPELVEWFKTHTVEDNSINDYSHLQIFTAAELAELELSPIDPYELADRLQDCDSVVKDGQWLYDKVPQALVQDLLDYLRLQNND